MKRLFCLWLVLMIGLGLSCAKEKEQSSKRKIILLISEQNIQGPHSAWWLSEVDLSTAETVIAQNLVAAGFEIISPQIAREKIRLEKAFRILDLDNDTSIKLGKITGVDFILVGKAIASAGANVAQSNMRSCFANINARLIRIKDKKVLAFFEESGSSIHLDLITGGKEALKQAGQSLAYKLIDILNKEEVRQ